MTSGILSDGVLKQLEAKHPTAVRLASHRGRVAQSPYDPLPSQVINQLDTQYPLTGSSSGGSGLLSQLLHGGQNLLHAGQGLLQGVSDLGEGGANVIDKGINALMGTHLSAPHGDVFAWNPLARKSGAAKVGHVIGELAGSMAAAPMRGVGLLPLVSAAARQSGLLAALHHANEPKSMLSGIGKALLKGAAMGAISGGLFGMGGKVVAGSVMRPLAGSIANRTLSPLMSQVGKLLTQSSQGLPSLQEALGQAYQQAKARVNWQALTPLAQQADQAGVPFETQQVVDRAKALLQAYSGKINMMPEVYGKVGRVLAHMIDKPPRAYQQAMWWNEKLNKLPDSYSDMTHPEQGVLRQVSAQLRQAVRQQLHSNAKQSPSGQAFVKAFDDQLKHYAGLHRFYETPVAQVGSRLRTKPTQRLTAMMKDTQVPPQEYVRHFMPTAAQPSTLKMQHVSRLLADRPEALPMLKMAYFGPAFEGWEPEGKTLLQLYRKLSPAQRQYLLTSKERQWFEAALAAKQISLKQTALKKLVHQLGHYTMAGLLGWGAAKEGGFAPYQGIGAGLMAAAAVPRLAGLLGETLAGPRGVRWLKRLATSGSVSPWANYLLTGAVNQGLDEYKYQHKVS